ncbi:hypothetical protein ACLOJK_039010 [Asimina triloba]
MLNDWIAGMDKKLDQMLDFMSRYQSSGIQFSCGALDKEHCFREVQFIQVSGNTTETEVPDNLSDSSSEVTNTEELDNLSDSSLEACETEGLKLSTQLSQHGWDENPVEEEWKNSMGSSKKTNSYHGQQSSARASVSGGASIGGKELLDLGEGRSNYLGKGVLKAVVNTATVPVLVGKDPTDQADIEILWFSCLKEQFMIGASVKKIPLFQHLANFSKNITLLFHMPAFNVIKGGLHAGNKLAIQESIVLPVGAVSSKEAMRLGVGVYHNLNAVTKEKYGQSAITVGDESGFTPNIPKNKGGLEFWLGLHCSDASTNTKGEAGSCKSRSRLLWPVLKESEKEEILTLGFTATKGVSRIYSSCLIGSRGTEDCSLLCRETRCYPLAAEVALHLPLFISLNLENQVDVQEGCNVR